MDLAIVIVSYNTRELTLACLASVFQALEASGLKGEVWVVDNASADGSAAAIRARFPQVHLWASEENLGFAGGVNRMLAELEQLAEPPRHVLLLNPDTLVAQDALGHLVQFMDATPRAGVAGAQLRYGDGSFQHGAFRFPTLLMALFDFWVPHPRLLDSPLNGRYPRRLYARGRPFPVDHPLGAALLIRWEALRQVGPLDEGFFMYCEEVDWCRRAKAAGWQVYCVPQAIITHFAGQSARQFRERMFVALWRSRYRLFRKHYGPLYCTLARWIVHAGLALEMHRLRRRLLRGELGAQEAEARLAAYRQVWEM
jgi:N-acetylglucosaminyl-diphospho-decaprenol L-rhamnosyltransferase